jgi:TonB-dependent SusC/RagA subfamily outer membrane receptor
MTPLLIYLLKVIAVSGILYGYYLLALRNKVFHSWNRFYLLATIGLSILLPLIDLNIMAPADNGSKVVTALQVVAGADEYMDIMPPQSEAFWSMERLVHSIYLLVSAATLIWLLVGLSKILNMIRRNPRTRMGNIAFLNTREEGTPFSFFQYLFWHEEIDPASVNGQKILEHELVHIREKHSHDKLFVHIILTIFWANPFFWLIRKELAMVHEFIADQQTVDDGESFAQLILSATFPEHSNLLTNPYFHSSIKRRIDMITRNKHPRYQYISRLLLIPVLFVLFFTFGVKAKNMLSESAAPIRALDQKITVVIDAGHGGFDPGATNGSAKEKDLNLELARLVKTLNKNPNLEIILTREEDRTLALSSRKELADKNQADLFISLHTDASPNAKLKGFSAFISGNNRTFETQNQRLASLFLHNLSGVYTTNKDIKKRETPLYVLDKSNCPAVILQNGFITNPDDKAFITQKSNQEKVAATILQSIEEYFSDAVQVVNTTFSMIDTVPGKKVKTDTIVLPKEMDFTGTIQTSDARVFIDGKEMPKGSKVSFIRADKVYIQTDSKGRETIFITRKDSTYKQVVGTRIDTANVEEITVTGRPTMKVNPIYILEGKQISKEEMEKITAERIESVTVLKGESATELYGTRGANGVVEIKLKDGQSAQKAASSNEVTVVGYSKAVQKTSSPEVITMTFRKNDAASDINWPNWAAIERVGKVSEQVLYIVNGEEMSEEAIKDIQPTKIESITILKGDKAIKKYGAKGRQGVMEIQLKK